MLGPPYSNCIDVKTSNDYNNMDFEYYKKNMCEMQGMYFVYDIAKVWFHNKKEPSHFFLFL